jgi:hypothetical protein
MKKMLLMLLFVVTVASLNSCTNDEPSKKEKLSKTKLILHVGETETITYEGKDLCNWYSQNNLIASVDNGKIKANLVGKTNIYANDLECNVEVLPNITMYDEPYLNWGTTKSDVKKYMSSYTLTKETSNQLAYKGVGNEFAYIYTFENGVLSGASMGILYSNSERIVYFMAERYSFTGEIDDYYPFVSPDDKTYGAISLENSYVMVIYMPRSNKRSLSTINLENIHKEVLEDIIIK